MPEAVLLRNLQPSRLLEFGKYITEFAEKNSLRSGLKLSWIYKVSLQFVCNDALAAVRMYFKAGQYYHSKAMLR